MSRNYDAIVPYYGCKRQLADKIVEAIGEHKAYWEPFCGSCAVLFAKPLSRVEVVNDLHQALVNLASVVRDDHLAPILFDRLSRTAFCEGLYEDSVKRLEHCDVYGAGLLDLYHAYHYFVVSWAGRNGLAGTAREAGTGFCKRFTSNGGDPAMRFRRAVERIPAWWERLRHAMVLNEDGLELIGRIEDKAGTAIYCDPPYLSKNAKYLHDFDDAQHAELARLLGRFEKTRVVVSYYDDPELKDLYPPELWENRQVSVQSNLAGGRKAPEVLLVNRA